MWRTKPFFDTPPDTIFLWKLRSFPQWVGHAFRWPDLNGVSLLLEGQLLCQEHNFEKTLARWTGCRKPFFFALDFLLCSVRFRQFFHYYRGLDSSGIRLSAGHDIGLRLKSVCDFLRGEFWVFDSNLRNGFSRISGKIAWSPTAFLFSSPFSLNSYFAMYCW